MHCYRRDMLYRHFYRVFYAIGAPGGSSSRRLAGAHVDMPQDVSECNLGSGQPNRGGGAGRYLELVPMWTYCFDDLDTMNAFTSIAAALPIRHAQVVVYPHYQLYDPNFGWARHTNSEWEKKLEKVSAACERIPGLATLLLSLQPRPQYGIFVDKQAVLDSCRQLTVSCRVQAEILGRPDQDVVTNREDAMMNIRIEIERRQLHLDCELMNVGEVRDNLETHEPRSSRRALNQIPREVRNI
ncbi:hypothetical protein B0H67DRAFT_307348 [Lasiosphaeris hirsuta]|uniref:Uncharacterized protein n=1 Tax=Lasiosphaeris hirsuta TaxID=260670 RepID=A0AA40A1D9_9PEZI|nr:hypothetical protein B0H67DRAFT_307348 [Lasiosphaeris hirsuta]